MADIFISYSKRDPEPTKALAADLEAMGYTTWWDTSLLPGDRFPEKIRQELEAAKAVIVIWSEHSVTSEWVYAEAQIAQRLGKLITVHADGLVLERVPMPFNGRHIEPVANRTKLCVALEIWGVKPGSAGGGKTVTVVTPPPPKPAAERSSLEWSRAEWERLRNSTDVKALKRFEEHAHSYYADDVRERIEFLEAEAARREQERVEAERKREEEEARRKAEAEAKRLRAEEEARQKAEAERLHEERIRRIKPGSGESFRDAPFAPEMVVVPAGEFLMGSPENEPERSGDEGPQHKVMIPRPFAVGRFALTFDEWDAAVADGACGGYKPSDEGWGRGRRPVINVSWEDAQGYIKWLKEKTGKDYRLLSEAEWEYVCRAGTKTRYWWGDSISSDQANCSPNNGKTVPVDSFKPNPWGLYQVHGNVWEWCEDTWHENYNGAPADGMAWLKGGNDGLRVLRGGSWNYIPGDLRSARRDRNNPGNRDNRIGFRLART